LAATSRKGGSIDDLSGEELAGAAAKIEKAAAALLAKQAKALATTQEKQEKASAAKQPVSFEECWRELEKARRRTCKRRWQRNQTKKQPCQQSNRPWH
jgi:hypothetical protein